MSNKQCLNYTRVSLILLLGMFYNTDSRAEDKYSINTIVDCRDYCSSNSYMNFACEIGYNFSGACVYPDDDGPCYLVGICYSKEGEKADKELEKELCSDRYQAAIQECSPGSVVDWSCFVDNNQAMARYSCGGTTSIGDLDANRSLNAANARRNILTREQDNNQQSICAALDFRTNVNTRPRLGKAQLGN